MKKVIVIVEKQAYNYNELVSKARETGFNKPEIQKVRFRDAKLFNKELVKDAIRDFTKHSPSINNLSIEEYLLKLEDFMYDYFTIEELLIELQYYIYQYSKLYNQTGLSVYKNRAISIIDDLAIDINAHFELGNLSLPYTMLVYNMIGMKDEKIQAYYKEKILLELEPFYSSYYKATIKKYVIGLDILDRLLELNLKAYNSLEYALKNDTIVIYNKNQKESI